MSEAHQRAVVEYLASVGIDGAHRSAIMRCTRLSLSEVDAALHAQATADRVRRVPSVAAWWRLSARELATRIVAAVERVDPDVMMSGLSGEIAAVLSPPPAG